MNRVDNWEVGAQTVKRKLEYILFEDLDIGDKRMAPIDNLDKESSTMFSDLKGRAYEVYRVNNGRIGVYSFVKDGKALDKFAVFDPDKCLFSIVFSKGINKERLKGLIDDYVRDGVLKRGTTPDIVDDLTICHYTQVTFTRGLIT